MRHEVWESFLTFHGRFSDLAMLQLLNGRERSKSDWRRLFKEVDSRLDVDFERREGNIHVLECEL